MHSYRNFQKNAFFVLITSLVYALFYVNSIGLLRSSAQELNSTDQFRPYNNPTFEVRIMYPSDWTPVKAGIVP